MEKTTAVFTWSAAQGYFIFFISISLQFFFFFPVPRTSVIYRSAKVRGHKKKKQFLLLKMNKEQEHKIHL